jgi:hypothetical protein
MKDAQVARSKAGQAVGELEKLIVGLLTESPEGLRNIEIATALGLQSAPNSLHKNWLTWSILQRMLGAKLLEVEEGRRPRYRLTAIPKKP